MHYYLKEADEPLTLRGLADGRVEVESPSGLALEDGWYHLWRSIEGEGSSHFVTAEVQGSKIILPGDNRLSEPKRMALSFLPISVGDRWRESVQRPDAILRQAVANLSALAALSAHELQPEDQALCMHFRSGRATALPFPGVPLDRPAPTSVPPHLPYNTWASWLRYIELRKQLERRGVKLPTAKLYRHLWLDSSQLPSGETRSLRRIIDVVTELTGTFNYRSCSFEDAKKLATRYGAQVLEVPELESPSSLVRVFRGRKQHRDYILVQKSLSPIAKTFLSLYEVGHILRDLVVLRQLPGEAPSDSAVLSLPHDLIERDSDAKAEMFALVGLFPTPDVAWEFRHELGSTTFLQLMRRDAPDERISGRLLQYLDPSLAPTPSLEEDWPMGWNNLLARRLESAFEHFQKTARWLKEAINRSELTPAQADGLSAGLAGCWARLDRHHRLVAYSNQYRKMPMLTDEQLTGMSVIGLADEPTRARFRGVREQWRVRREPVIYYFGFARPRIGARLLTLPIVEGGEVVGSLAILEEIRCDKEVRQRIGGVPSDVASEPNGPHAEASVAGAGAEEYTEPGGPPEPPTDAVLAEEAGLAGEENSPVRDRLSSISDPSQVAEMTGRDEGREPGAEDENQAGGSASEGWTRLTLEEACRGIASHVHKEVYTREDIAEAIQSIRSRSPRRVEERGEQRAPVAVDLQVSCLRSPR